jgi:MGT family glycosyltransferase
MMVPSNAQKNILIATWEGGGTVGPAMTVATKLISRGHHVRVMSDRCNEGEAKAAGASFVPWRRAPSRIDRSRDSDIMRDWEAASPPEGLIRAIERVWCGPALAYATDLIAELERQPADLVVSSEMLFGVAAACEARKQKLALLTAGINLYPVPGAPPLGSGLAAPRNAADHARIADVTSKATALLDHGLPALNAARKALGLAELQHVFDQEQAAARVLIGTSSAFDFAPAVLPTKRRYVGPQLAAPAWAAPWQSPWPADDSRPLVLVAFSTTFQDHTALLQRIIDAAGELPIRLLVTLGGVIAPDELRTGPNVALVDSAPHDTVMQTASLVVTHGGHGTVLRALSHRRPLLILPLGRDQNDNAIRVTERGAGLSLPATAGVPEIAAALHRLLTEPDFGRAATRLGTAIAADVASPDVVLEIENLMTDCATASCVRG